MSQFRWLLERLGADPFEIEPRPAWWKVASSIAVLAMPVPVVVGVVWFTRQALDMSDDDFLFLLGFFFLIAAGMGIVAACAVLAAAGATVARIAADRRDGRWLLIALGAGALGFGVMMLWIGAPVDVTVAWEITAGSLAVILGVGAPAPVREAGPIIEG